jgi:hypothetical protein
MSEPKYKVGDQVVFRFNEPDPNNNSLVQIERVVEGPNDDWIYWVSGIDITYPVHERFLFPNRTYKVPTTKPSIRKE